ncbi:hypothetical protein [Photobacterium lipolyticum]|uniref:Alginate export domain-containing protein n=1 Tax=Photobacterium lipolyticum TaxID=266810 RepID=A0A2T3N2N1_9GAMM|nr:hypothetical protein [Photobacterium lipolyticum]PSW06629.1 hypothetical protein C9I89_03580 [Photobacterium lipolyticum]
MKLGTWGYAVILAVLPYSVASAQDLNVDWRGHIKGQLNYQTYPSDSLINQLGYNETLDINNDTRLGLDSRMGAWKLNVDYQFITLAGDSYEFAQRLPANPLLPAREINDDYRLFDLTHVITTHDRHALVQRLDRLSLSVHFDNLVLKAGRQAISWGNGLIYAPMDFFNPFSPASIDKEYKSGDDLLYGQYLTEIGDDVQFVWVGRRDVQGNVSSNVDSLAVKYHSFGDESEWDFLLAEHFEDDVAGLGFVSNIGSAVWRSDATLTRTTDKNIWSFVSNWSYSWMWEDKNISAIAEYYYNGFGQADGNYSTAALANNPALLNRIERGELYTLGRHYLASSLTIELSPLWLLTPSTFINLSDTSALFQVISQHDIEQDLQLLVAVNLPVGAKGTEFGGVEVSSGLPVNNQTNYLATDLGLQAQIAWYF